MADKGNIEELPQGIEERLKLNVYEYLDDRVAKKFRNIMWQGALVIGVCTVFISLLGYSHISSFLSERLEKQVDEYFATHGGKTMQDNLAEAQALIVQSKRTLDMLEKQDDELNKLEALKRLQFVEAELAENKKMLGALGYGVVHLVKGQEFQIATGPVVLTYKVRDITTENNKLTIFLDCSEGVPRQTVVFTYVLDKDGHAVFEKKADLLITPTMAQNVELVILHVTYLRRDTISVMTCVRICPSMSMEDRFSVDTDN